MERIDRKFTITATCTEHDHTFTEIDSVLFLAKDKALPATLQFYRAECERIGAGLYQLMGIDLLIQRVLRFQRERPDLVKVPDVDDTKEGRAIILPNEPAP
jgi:hypothetical protein